MNQIFTGDCLEILRGLPDNHVDLIYLDPPFFTQKTHSLRSRTTAEEYAFADKWASREEYLDFLTCRLTEMYRLMKDTATLFFHCDRSAAHHIRLLLDKVFGEDQFLSEIVWVYRRWSNAARGLLNAHQIIYMYAKTATYQFHPLMTDYSHTTNLDQILQKRVRNQNGQATYARDENGAVILNGPKRGVPLSDVWEIPFLNPKAKERVGYPTQKPLLLLERIIQIATNPGDLVLDPFCGSGTTLVAAARLDRQYIGIDLSTAATRLTQQRLANPIKSDSLLLKKGAEAYANLPEEVKEILQGLPVKFVQRNSGIDAIYDDYIAGRPVLLRVQRPSETLAEAAHKLAMAGRKKQAAAMLLIQTQPDSRLFDDAIPNTVMVIDSVKRSLDRCIQQILENGESRRL